MENVRLLTPFMTCFKKDFPIAAALVNPLGTNPVLDGEWMQVDASGNAVRYTNNAAQIDAGHANAGRTMAFLVFAESGRSDVQALQALPLMLMHEFVGETKIFTAAGLYEGAPLAVKDLTYPAGGTTRRGLVLADAASSQVVVAFARKIGSTWLEFHRVSPFVL